MPNTNLLKGMRCPDCGSEGPFRFAVEAIALIHDDGVIEYEMVCRKNTSWCVCRDCHFGGHISKFLTAEANHDNH